ncbi:phosphoenolpyruvate carboxykinase (ATP), partial [Reinekea sp.]|uniref:phosphoenolpyruvate carboxykinase (ATP) n=1 Tax=Reinekea sp. TaxID=1970455 RepID=UPI002A818674
MHATTPFVHVDLPTTKLLEIAVRKEEGEFAANGAFVAVTGARTGRSPKDRFIVDDPEISHLVDWGPVNQHFAVDKFDALWTRVSQYLAAKESFVGHLEVGSA